MEQISSRDNEKIKLACRIASSATARDEHNLFFAEGRRLCFDLAQTAPPKMAFFTKQFLQSYPEVETLAEKNYLVNEPVADKLSGTKNSQGVYCLYEILPTSMEDLVFERGVLLCENLQNPDNMGAMIRSAAAFGYGGVVLVGGVDIYNTKVLRASMGGVGRIPVVQHVGLEELRTHMNLQNATLYAAALENAKPLTDVTPEGAFVVAVGNEGAGLSEDLLAMAGEKIYIPMKNGMESLNAAVAASVLMFHFKGV